MVKPYLVDNFQLGGRIEKQNEPEILIDKICSDQTLQQLKECLEGVCIEGTAKTLFKNSFYKVAGKTGTALVANGSHGYAEHIYQSSFVGYFPADHPQYSCIVVIKNRPFAKKFLGASVAGPVFKEVSDKLMSLETNQDKVMMAAINEAMRKKDSAQYYYSGNAKDIRHVMQTLNVVYKDSIGKSDWGRMYPSNYEAVLNEKIIDKKLVPDVKGMGLKDALAILEERNIKVSAKGIGKVKQQSIQPGTVLTKNETLTLELN
jgi:cell division protein FtsI (penicillin-binding protein 3)